MCVFYWSVGVFVVRWYGVCDESYGRRVEVDGLCIWIWCGNDGDCYFWVCCGFLCVEEDDGESGVLGLNN